MPVLTRGLKDKSEEIQRTCCQIVDNMCQVVEDPGEVQPLMSKLAPLVKGTCEKMSDPEARNVAEKAMRQLTKAATGTTDKLTVSVDQALASVDECFKGKPAADDAAFADTAKHVAALASMATNMSDFDSTAWKASVSLGDDYSDTIEELRVKMEVASKPKEEIEEEDTEGVDLYKGAFSLAYGTLTLLRDAKMHLKRNRFYGLLGPNQCGKTTLMRA